MLSAIFFRLLRARWPRTVLDVGACGGFAVLFVLMVSGAGPAGRSLSAGAVELNLRPGGQRQGLYRGANRIATLSWRVRRQGTGWTVTHAITPGGASIRSTGGADAASPSVRIRLGLRRDLSLESLQLSADLSRLSRLSGLPRLPISAAAELKELRVSLGGDCNMETGDCKLRGAVGSHRVDHVVSAGRGPVLTSTIYPLLARGSLGGTAEVRIFDPMTLRQRVVTFTVEGRERVRLRSGVTLDAVRVHRDLEGLATRVWIDDHGRVLREELPLGLVVEHEAWVEPGRRP